MGIAVFYWIRDLENIIRVLHVFYLASGLKINIHKSYIYGIGVNEDEVYNMASNAGCIAGNIPFNYLGLPIGSNMKSIASWKMLIDRFRSRLSTWKASFLSIGCRLTLIKSILGSLGIYYLLIFRAPKSVLNDLEIIRSNFFWGVKDAHNIIDQKTLPSLPSTSWDKIIPRKVNIFMWRLSLDRLPHRLNLSLRGMDIPAISCSSCNANVESANHIFFECIIAYDLWKLVYRWCEIPFVQALSFEAFKDWLSSWHAPKEKKHRLFIISTSRQFDFILDGLAEVPSNDRVFGQWLNALFQKAAFLSRLLSRGLFGVSSKTTSE
ncbi:RNA-directed DNA polymerase, eukaryota [Tanacetum coccineum]